MGCRIWAVVALGMVGWMPVRAQSPEAPWLVLPEAKGHRLVLIDPRAKRVVGEIGVPGWPHEVVFSPDGGTAYVPSYSDAIVGMAGRDGQAIDVVDMRTRRVRGTWELGRPLRPHMPMLEGEGSLLVSTELAEAIAVVDRRDGRITGQIPTGAKESHVFVRTADGRKIYTANLHGGSVSVLDVRARRLVKVIPISGLVNRVALSADGRRVYATDGDSPTVVAIDTASDEVVGRIAVSAAPFSIATTPDGRWLVVGEDVGTKGRLEVLDAKELTVKHVFEVDRLPLGIKVLGDEVFVACYLSGSVDVLNLATWTMEAPILNVAHGDGLAVWGGAR